MDKEPGMQNTEVTFQGHTANMHQLGLATTHVASEIFPLNYHTPPLLFHGEGSVSFTWGISVLMTPEHLNSLVPAHKLLIL